MICTHCRTDTVEWIGPIADLGTHGTRCRSCGGMNCQEVERPEIEHDGPCPECKTMGLKPHDPEGYGCSCHIAPPCWRCSEAPLHCDACGWTEART